MNSKMNWTDTTVVEPMDRSLPEPLNPSDRAVEVERSFQEFRASSARLVERVTDLAGEQVVSTQDSMADVQLVRTVFGKWSTEILRALHASPSLGFEALRRELPGISPRVLSLKLRTLEENRMISRRIADNHPPRTFYSLTQRGWTIAWLSHPVLLYLHHIDPTKSGSVSDGPPSGPPTDERQPDSSGSVPPVPGVSVPLV
jgi:DNA-binding HxlR family transcriptional regulator